MSHTVSGELDLIEELRLRRWARENYVPRGQRQQSWHPVVLDEMHRKDGETEFGEVAPALHVWMKS